MSNKPEVAVIGIGTIGKRVSDAIINSKRLNLRGVAVRRLTPSLLPFIMAKVPIYYTDTAMNDSLNKNYCSGNIYELLAQCDVIVDCTPRGTGEFFRQIYADAGVRVIYQGGEKSSIADISYCSGIGFNEALQASTVRVLSCNTTGLIRLIQAITLLTEISCIRAVLIRSSTDPDKSFKGDVNNIQSFPGKSHHGSDIKHFFPNLDIITQAVSAPVNCGHLINLFIKPKASITKQDLISSLNSFNRITLVNGPPSLSKMRAYGDQHYKYDCSSLVVWEDSIQLIDGEILIAVGIHMESIVVPETMDVLFGMTGIAKTLAEAQMHTENSLTFMPGEIC
ncbi:type II glyceraldehyde-3-phosphate dehydrogenase [Halomonas sp. KM-1]|uniref:type II glyceraldehyde-3-phosphate dehydrogenase n=1 Tax=Halomonas sp. KM-1 TaxID=590061 RepID=UPI00028A13B4|nr:type II glyceraldehyde-3-phosphate dehydrogenase [Halomonas sp. KM-1]